jgi:hypothetical protein
MTRKIEMTVQTGLYRRQEQDVVMQTGLYRQPEQDVVMQTWVWGLN